MDFCGLFAVMPCSAIRISLSFSRKGDLPQRNKTVILLEESSNSWAPDLGLDFICTRLCSSVEAAFCLASFLPSPVPITVQSHCWVSSLSLGCNCSTYLISRQPSVPICELIWRRPRLVWCTCRWVGSSCGKACDDTMCWAWRHCPNRISPPHEPEQESSVTNVPRQLSGIRFLRILSGFKYLRGANLLILSSILEIVKHVRL